MGQSEIDAVRALLGSKPRPVGWAERRRRLDEVGAVWPVAEDMKLEAVDLGGVPGEWSIVPGSDASRVLVFFHGGGYCSGSIRSHRRMVTEAGRAAGTRSRARRSRARMPSIPSSTRAIYSCDAAGMFSVAGIYGKDPALNMSAKLLLPATVGKMGRSKISSTDLTSDP